MKSLILALLVFVCLGASMKETRSEKKETNTIQKWEYKVVLHGTMWTTEKRSAEMTALGSDGWEAFMVDGFVYFRRPVGN